MDTPSGEMHAAEAAVPGMLFWIPQSRGKPCASKREEAPCENAVSMTTSGSLSASGKNEPATSISPLGFGRQGGDEMIRVISP